MAVASGSLCTKTVLRPSTNGVDDVLEFKDGCKVIFHFRTQLLVDEEDVYIDDTRTMRRPMELIFGKQFKLEIWEQCIRSMRIGEMSRFVVDKSLVSAYPVASKMIRSAFGHHAAGASAISPTHGHCCGMMGLSGGRSHADGIKAAVASLGHADLDDLVRSPRDLVFTFELLQVISPGDYEKYSWAMDSDEMLASIPQLKTDGNRLYGDGKLAEAGLKYAEALGRLEQLMLKEKPGDEEWSVLDAMKVPLLLNYSQCKLLEGDFYPVIQHTSEVLKQNPDNVKALFRRAQAHVGAWNPTEAKKDFERARHLDPSLCNLVDKELRKLDEEIRRKNEDDKYRLMGKMF